MVEIQDECEQDKSVQKWKRVEVEHVGDEVR